jgi:hypothetical protein
VNRITAAGLAWEMLMGKRIAVFGPTREFPPHLMGQVASYLEEYDTPGVTLCALDGGAYIEHRDGGRIGFYSLDDPSYRGHMADILYLEECGEVTEEQLASILPIVATSAEAEVIIRPGEPSSTAQPTSPPRKRPAGGSGQAAGRRLPPPPPAPAKGQGPR